MVDFVDLDKKRMDDIVADELEKGVGKKMPDIVFFPGKKVVHTDHIRPVFQKGVTQVAAKKTGPAGHKDSLHFFSFLADSYYPAVILVLVGACPNLYQRENTMSNSVIILKMNRCICHEARSAPTTRL
jgi:hypothetical protein